MASLPNYVASAKPAPQAGRVPWYKTTAQTYAGIMLWFAFWQVIAVGKGTDKDFGQYSAFAGGVLSHGRQRGHRSVGRHDPDLEPARGAAGRQ